MNAKKAAKQNLARVFLATVAVLATSLASTAFVGAAWVSTWFVTFTLCAEPHSFPDLARPGLEKLEQSAAVFTENQGQWPEAAIRFALSRRGVNIGLAEDGLRFQASRSEPPGRLTWAMRFVGSCQVGPQGERPSGQVFHYRLGEPARWRENVKAYERVVYRGLYEGVDLRVTGSRRGLKYEFIVAPEADWRQIEVRYEGVERLLLRQNGLLEVQVDARMPSLVDAAPVIYQEIRGQRVEVAGSYRLVDDLSYGFVISGPFDSTQPLVIDPELEWSTYIGGSESDSASRVAVDGQGNIFVAGLTSSTGWISGGFDEGYNGNYDIFVLKLNPTGVPLWSTYLGGSQHEDYLDMAVDSEGNVLVSGATWSDDGWLSGGWIPWYSGASDGFLVKLNAAGQYLWSTYLGGPERGYAEGVAVDREGNIVVVGGTESDGWVNGGFDTSLNGGFDVFVAKFSPAGEHVWSTYLGGSGWEGGHDVATDGNGNVLVVGTSEFGGWARGGFDTSLDGFRDGFVAKLNSTGAHVWSTYLGGSADDYAWTVAVDSAGNVLAAGYTRSAGWARSAFDTTFNGDGDGFVTKLTPSGSLLWTTYVGGLGWDFCSGIATDVAGSIMVTGSTWSEDWVSGGFGTSVGLRGFILKMDPAGGHVWSSSIEGIEEAACVAVDSNTNLFVVGTVYSSRDGDGFLMKIRDVGAGNLQVSLAPPEAVAAGAKWRFRNSTAWRNSGDTVTNLPVGQHVIEFKEITGWDAIPLPVRVTDGQTASVTRIYARSLAQVSWGSYLGGNRPDSVGSVASDGAVAVDSVGNIIVVGATESSGWVRNGFDTNFSSPDDRFIAKLSPTGAHVWSTYVDDYPYVAALDREDNLIVAGDREFGSDVFVAKYSSAGSPVWARYFGGDNADHAEGIALDLEGNIVLTGWTASAGWIQGGFDTSYNGGPNIGDGFVLKLSPSGEHLWSSYLGGQADDQAVAVDVDGSGSIYLAGWTQSGGWVSGGFNTTNGNGFVVKVSPVGNHLWSTFITGGVTALAVDPSGDVLVTGRTGIPGWVSGGSDTNHHGEEDAFVVRLSSTGAHVWSTYLGGALGDGGTAIALDAVGNIYVAGETSSSGWVHGAFDSSYNGGDRDGFLVKLGPDGEHLWSAYLGGARSDSPSGIAVDQQGAVVVVGFTTSAGWLQGGYDVTYGGGVDEWGNPYPDAFVVKITPPRIRILGLTRSEGLVTLIFEAPGYGKPSLFVEGAASLSNPVAWQPEIAATITSIGAGRFEALLPSLTDSRFFRVRVQGLP